MCNRKEIEYISTVHSSIALLESIGFSIHPYEPLPRQMYLLPIGKEYSIYTITNRLIQIKAWNYCDIELIKSVIANKDFELSEGFVKRIA